MSTLKNTLKKLEEKWKELINGRHILLEESPPYFLYKLVIQSHIESKQELVARLKGKLKATLKKARTIDYSDRTEYDLLAEFIQEEIDLLRQDIKNDELTLK